MRASAPQPVPNRAGPGPIRSVFIAVEPPALQRLIGYVLDGQSGFRVVGTCVASPSLTRRAARLAADVIIVNHRLQRKQRGDVLVDLRRASPSSTLILLTHSLGESDPPDAADAWLAEDAVVRRLVPAIREAAPRVPCPPPRRASARPRT
jgi:DNA-binding NarL/FixJ family response regulator